MKLGKQLARKPLAIGYGLLLGLGVSAAPFSVASDYEELQETSLASSASESESEEEVKEVEEVEVTGSRLKRNTYTSIAPLQVISGQISRESGLMDAGEILQSSTAASGQQIDLTFGGFVLDNGPGATTVDLRGLGADRTLVLINGRRVAPAGVEGAPSSPDLGLIPTSLVSQYDILLDGASSVYGSDAVAGVANVILRKDFDGFEAEVFSRIPEHGGGEETTLRLAWGKNYDRGFIAAGLEYQQNEVVTLEDRPWTAGCERNHEIDENGNIRSEDQFYSNVYGMPSDGCQVGSLAGRVSVPFAGSIYYTPGSSNGGWNNFSESSLFGAFGVDGNGDGITDVNFRDYDLNGRNQDAHLFPDVKSYSFMTYGEYTFEGDANITPYFEVLYAKREFYSYSGQGQLFPSVPALNPYNICNPDAEGGVDCGLAYDELMNNVNVVNAVLNAFGCDPSTGGNCDQTGGPIGAAGVTPIVSVRGDRSITDVEVDQLRFVTGVTADLPFMNVGSLSNWSVDASLIYSKSTGTSARPGVRDDRLNLALGAYSTTGTPCVNDTGTELAGDVEAGCVAVNLFAPSLYEGVIGDFATAAERNYLFDNRDFDTEYEQMVISAYASGEIFQMPAGAVAAGFGVEWRNDEINSIPDQVASDGLLFGFFSDGGAVGEKTTKEVFGEIEIPLLAGKTLAEELVVNLSARWTDDELYGSQTTTAYKIGYRPFSSLLLRATAGSSFRAPNLREVFLRSQSGFGNVFDPCFVPDGAIDPISGGYNPAADNREQEVIDNCRANGVDPTIANNNGFNTYSVEISAGGSTTLDAEESDAFSVGFAWDQPFTNAFELSIGATYYEIEVENTIIEPSAQFIVNDCYNSNTGNSAFCSRISRDLSDPTQPFLDIIDNGFLNRDEEKTRGIDVNIRFDDTLTIGKRPIEIGADITANHTKSRSTLFVDDEGNIDSEEFVGEWGFPDWRARALFRAEMDEWSMTWEASYIGAVSQDALDVDDFSEAINGTSDTCVGPPDDVLCRDYAEADPYWVHALSVYYTSDDGWYVGGGFRNIFDKEPPEVDGSEVLAINNTPIGYGYDVQGRTFFLNVQYSFGGGE